MSFPTLIRRSGNRALFESLAMPLTRPMYATAFRLTRSPAEAEDLVQETFTRAYEHFSKFRPGTNMRGWLVRIMTNLYINEYRRRRRAHEHRCEAQLSVDTSPPSSNYVGTPFRHRLTSEVLDAIQKLPEDFRVALTLADVEQLSYQEIAEAMNCPIGTVMSRLFRARTLLKHTLAEGDEAGRRETPVNLDAFRSRKKVS